MVAHPGGLMFWFMDADSGGEVLLAIFLGLLIGAFCGGLPLAIGLIRGNRSMAWTGFGVCTGAGVACFPMSILISLIFTLIVALIEPMDKKKRKKRRRRRERADDFIDEHIEERRRRQREEREEQEDDDRPRRRGRKYDVVDEDDEEEEERPRRRRRYEDEDDEEDERPRRRRR